MKKSTCLAIAILAMWSGAVPSAQAKPKAAADTVAAVKNDYSFRHKLPLRGIVNYYSGIYGFNTKDAVTCRGDMIATHTDTITSMALNPSGLNMALVGHKKKKRNEAAVYSMYSPNTLIKKLDLQKQGKVKSYPSAVVFTSDARNLLVGSRNRINRFDTKKFEPVDTFAFPITPTILKISSNNYFLAGTDGDKVVVYNYEERKPRQSWELDGGVSDIGFNDDNTEFAILTVDGVLSIYDTRTFMLKKMLDHLGDGLSFDYNADGKYVAVATSPNTTEVVNLLDTKDRSLIDSKGSGMTMLMFVPDAKGTPLLVNNASPGVNVKRMYQLAPYYGKLINDGANQMLNEWLKMKPGESLEEYRERVNDASRAAQLQAYKDELATIYAGDLAAMSQMSLGKYDRGQGLLQLGFSNMPSILLPVPEADLQGFTGTETLQLRNVKYGVLPDDSFEIVYAEIYNTANGKVYVYNNLDRKPLSFMEGDDNVVSLEVIQKQQLEEMQLQAIRQKIVDQAKKLNVISDHTSITVDSRVDPTYDANGNKILNYVVKFNYEVDPEFTAVEDFAPGKYNIDESHAATAMLDIVKEALNGEFAQYVKEGKKLNIKISGTADATPVIRKIAYDGSFGEFEDEPVYQNDQLTTITVTPATGATTNEQLAYLRAQAVNSNLHQNINNLDKMNTDTKIYINVSEDKGSEYRRISAEFTFVDAI